MYNYYVCKLLKNPGIVIAETVVYANVEIRRAKKDDTEEMALLTESVEATNLKAEVEIELSCRIGTIVQAATEEEASNLADQRFVEILDLATVEYTMSHLSLAHCGYVKNLDSGECTTLKNRQYSAGTSFITSRGIMPQINTTQQILYRSGDLFERYKRSIHWYRNAQRENSIHINLLYRWFAVEVLFKETETDDVTGPFTLFLGFPGSTYSKYIDRDLLNRLSSNASYSKWKKQIKDIVDKIRKFRNDSVHSGFRSIDCTPDDLRLYSRIMTLGLGRCQGAVQYAVLSGLKSVTEFREYAGLIFENRSNVERDVIGNIIHILDHDHLKHVQSAHS
ncbi:HEPN domain-containing protein [Burkholderia multivorans]|uniref:HEPN domain-containing protein n=1 Tax=Burkholderia multivorans TaxID=87883 RepID=UPI0021D9C6D0|nr:HEPN domain-containing protein [Burkholderia multivorans]UXZ83495.1 HEPN domain-containing protein [Burkholderia multivorans]